MLRFICLWPGSDGEPIELPAQGRITIGRDENNVFFLEHDSVSSFHCVIEEHDRHYILRDLMSTNGTSVNGKKIHERELEHGDHLRIGSVEFRFECKPEPGVVASASDEKVVPVWIPAFHKVDAGISMTVHQPFAHAPDAAADDGAGRVVHRNAPQTKSYRPRAPGSPQTGRLETQNLTPEAEAALAQERLKRPVKIPPFRDLPPAPVRTPMPPPARTEEAPAAAAQEQEAAPAPDERDQAMESAAEEVAAEHMPPGAPAEEAVEPAAPAAPAAPTPAPAAAPPSGAPKSGMVKKKILIVRKRT